MNDMNIDFVCDTEDCIHWEQGVCKYPAAITLQEHCCVEYEHRTESHTMILQTQKFASMKRMVQIANDAIDTFGAQLNGRALYDVLAGFVDLSGYVKASDLEYATAEEIQALFANENSGE